VIEITDRALELLARATEAARRFDPAARIRIVGEPGNVRFVLVDGPEPNDRTVERGDVTIHVEAHLSGRIDLEEPHDRLVLRAPQG
jgi:hypothetical protein